MMVIAPWKSRCVGLAHGSSQNGKLRLSDGIAVFIYPGESVVAFGRANIDQHTLRLLHTWYVRFGRVDHIGEISNDLLQRWVMVDGIFPDLEGVGAQIHFCVRVAIENAGLLREQIADGLVVVVILKKGFIRANDLGIFLQPLPHAGTQADDALNSIGRQK
jgi:hypothetical protein